MDVCISKCTKGDFQAGLESSGVKNKCTLLIRVLKIKMCTGDEEDTLELIYSSPVFVQQQLTDPVEVSTPSRKRCSDVTKLSKRKKGE